MNVSAGRTAAWLAVTAAIVASCSLGGSNNTANNHPSPTVSSSRANSGPPSASPSSAPQPVTGSYGVLYSSQAASTYTVSIVGIDGNVVASADASTPASPTCGSSAAALVSSPVSMSGSRAYFMDGSGAVHWLDPSGGKDQAPIAMLPSPTTSRRSMFAVSPDDAEMAVVVDNFSSGGATTQLFMYDLNAGGTQRQVFSQTGSFTLWPVGWHGTNNLVLAVVASCTQGGGAFCCGPLELHVVDPATATRRFTLGSRTTCVIAGPASPGGAVCEQSPNFTTGTVLNWTAGTVRTLALNGPSFAYVAPGGGMVMLVDNSGTSFTLGAATIPNMFACTWIDDTHVMSGGDAQHQPRVADITTGKVVPVASQGDCAGRLPGGL